MRTHLARLLVMEPDLLMLDEPTNHLDLHSVLWFQNYLMNYTGAVLFISHDRAFLNRLAQWTVELRGGHLTRFRGNYDDYARLKDEALEQQRAAYKNQQREIERLTKFVERFRSKASKATQAQSKLKQLEKIERIEAPEEEKSKSQIPIPATQAQWSKKSFVLKTSIIAMVICRFTRVWISQLIAENASCWWGPNGAGKSTLLKLLADVMPVQKGIRELGHEVKGGYFSQQRIDVLNPERTLIEEALDTEQRITEQHARTVLGSFLFRGDDVFKKVKVLSGGEKSRLALIKLLLNPPNLLLMDEPTTHLDMSGIDALIAALNQFSGTLIFISHDVHFIRSIAEHVVHVEHGKLRSYHGNYDYYLSKQAEEESRLNGATQSKGKAQAVSRGATAVNKTMSSKERRRIEAEERNKRSAKLRKYKSKVDAIEKEITSLEEKQSALSVELEQTQQPIKMVLGSLKSIRS